MRWASRVTSPAGCVSWPTGRSWNRRRPTGCSANHRTNGPGASCGASSTRVACEAAAMSESSPEASNVIEVSDADMAAAAAEQTAAEDAEVSEETGGPFSQKTAWVRRMETPLRSFLHTETGSASVLAAATVLALIWANMSISSYEKFWSTQLSVTVGSSNVSLDVREFGNSGLMALFFLVVGLEARREFDVGELRVRSRLTLPLLVGLAGMAVPIAIFLVANAGHPAMHG